MKRNFISSLMKAFTEPAMILARAMRKLIRSLLAAVLEAPVEAFSVLSGRLTQKAQNLDTSLNEKAVKKQTRILEKRLEEALEQLYFSDKFLIHTRQTKKIKNLMIILLQAVSFCTTYRGLVQCFSALHWAVPLLLTIVIQTGLTYLAATINYHHAPRMQKALLAVMLAISISFSYVGVTETLMPYADYLEARYRNFSSVYEQARNDGMRLTEAGGDPAAEIEGQYEKIGQLLSDARNRYSDEVLQAAQKNLEEYSNRTITMMVQQPSGVYVDGTGQAYPTGGGAKTIAVPDPAAVTYIEEARKRVEEIERQRGNIDSIQALLAGTSSKEVILAAMERQLNSPDTALPEFIAANSAADTLARKCEELSVSMNSGIEISLDLYKLLQGGRDAGEISATEEAPSFNALRDTWRETEYRPAETGIALLDSTLAAFTVNDPARLKESVDEAVSDAYHTLLPALSYVGADEAAAELEDAYGAYRPATPINYAFEGFLPSNANFETAVLALVIALCNDGLAVAIGLWLEHRYINWSSDKTITRKDLMPGLYPHFKAVMMPALRKRVGKNSSFEAIQEAFLDLLTAYLAHFELCPMLVREGYTRYLVELVDDDGFKRFCSFLLMFDLAKPLNAEQAKTLGLSTHEQAADAQYLLLSSRAEGWLVEMLGSAADMDPIPGV